MTSLEDKYGNWLFFIPISGLTLTKSVNNEIRVNRVTFISKDKIPRVRKRLGLPYRFSELASQHNKPVRDIAGNFFKDSNTYAITRLKGTPKEKEKDSIRIVRDELNILAFSQLGYTRRRFIRRLNIKSGIHGGLYHSQSPEAQFLHTPGLVVVVVSSPYDAKGLLISAIQSQDPVLFLEPKRIYRSIKEHVPEESYTIPFGVAEVAMQGKDITLIGWGAHHHENLIAAKKLKDEFNMEVEVINLRSLNPLDIDTIVRSVQKTSRCVVSHEAPKTCGFGAEIAALVQQECFLHLEAPIMRCTGFDTPFPHTLEDVYLPDSDRVVKTLLDTLNF